MMTDLTRKQLSFTIVLILILFFAAFMSCDFDKCTIRETTKLTRKKNAEVHAVHDIYASSCEKVDTYISNGSPVGYIIESLVKEQNFSSYCRDDFDVAEEWFLNVTNHPVFDGKAREYHEYMKVSSLGSLGFYYDCD